MNSLRLRLILLLCLALGLAWGFAAWLSHIEARHEVDKLFDAQLAQSAQVLLITAGHELHERMEHGNDELPALHEYEQKIAFQIWYGDTLLLRSTVAPEKALTGHTPGFSKVEIDGKPWRVLTRRDDRHGFLIQVGEPLEQREVLSRHIALRMFLPSLAALPLLAFAIWAAVDAGLLPLRKLKREVAQREVDYLGALEMQGVPDEVEPLVAALNDLFIRLERAFESERRFTADAAHELRTPLAALKIQAQVAMRAANDSERLAALDNVLRGVDRASHLVEQLLTLARIDPDHTAAHYQPVELQSLAASVLADMAPKADAGNIALALAEGSATFIPGNSAQLAILLRNLLDNAIRYTPPGGHVGVEIRQDDDDIVLDVWDTGPGIAPAEREQVLHRFYRIPGNSTDGSGLGLSIVQRIADLHGAHFTLESNEGGGLRARLLFPARSKPPHMPTPG